MAGMAARKREKGKYHTFVPRGNCVSDVAFPLAAVLQCPFVACLPAEARTPYHSDAPTVERRHIAACSEWESMRNKKTVKMPRERI